MKTLKEIFDNNKCDKGSIRHRYDRVYEPKLQHLRNEKIKLLEIGVLRGESLASWLEFFPQAEIFGIDIFQRVPAKDVPVLNDPRVSWCNCDSIKGPTKEFKEIAGDGFNVIIDDGLHFLNAQRLTFENFFPFLKDNGVFFIEDVWPFDRMNKTQKQHKWIKKHPKYFTDALYKQLVDVVSPYNVEYHDLRKGFHPDTFIIEVKK